MRKVWFVYATNFEGVVYHIIYRRNLDYQR